MMSCSEGEAEQVCICLCDIGREKEKLCVLLASSSYLCVASVFSSIIFRFRKSVKAMFFVSGD